MLSFEIESYKVSTYIQRLTSGSVFERTLELKSVPLMHGSIRDQVSVILGFQTGFSGVVGFTAVGYLTTAPPSSTILGWLDLNEFNYYYDILRSEKPVLFFYELTDGSRSSGYLRRLGLGTSNEEIGEGPADMTPSR